MHERYSFEKVIWKGDYQKTFKKLTWIVPLHLVPCYRRDYEKQNRPRNSHKSLFGLQDMFRKILYSFISSNTIFISVWLKVQMLK